MFRDNYTPKTRAFALQRLRTDMKGPSKKSA